MVNFSIDAISDATLWLRVLCYAILAWVLTYRALRLRTGFEPVLGGLAMLCGTLVFTTTLGVLVPAHSDLFRLFITPVVVYAAGQAVRYWWYQRAQ